MCAETGKKVALTSRLPPGTPRGLPRQDKKQWSRRVHRDLYLKMGQVKVDEHMSIRCTSFHQVSYGMIKKKEERDKRRTTKDGASDVSGLGELNDNAD